MSDDPHADDECVVCGRGASVEGPVMHPIASIENGYVCEGCMDYGAPSMSEYHKATEERAIYLNESLDLVSPGLVYVSLGLAEAGEVQENVKKAIREDDVSYLNDIPDELGDVLWYAVRVAEELSAIDAVDFDGMLADIANAELLDRKDRGLRKAKTTTDSDGRTEGQ